jgi:hypothetical protein
MENDILEYSPFSVLTISLRNLLPEIYVKRNSRVANGTEFSPKKLKTGENRGKKRQRKIESERGKSNEKERNRTCALLRKCCVHASYV